MADFNKIKERLKAKMPDYLSELGVNDLNKNFLCVNPNHPHDNNTPSMKYYPDTQKIHCFGKCGVDWDIFDLYAVVNDNAQVEGTQALYDYKQVFSELANKYGIATPNYEQSADSLLKQKIDQVNAYLIRIAPTHLEETDYFKKRGISLETAKKYHLGYIAKWKNPKSVLQGKTNIPSSPRLIIPTSAVSYIARDTRSNVTGEAQNYVKEKAGNAHLFNGKALLQDKKPIFLVEGEIDALSILEASDKVEAVGLGSVQNQNKLIDALKKIQRQRKGNYQPAFLIAMDNDDAGDMANHQLEKKLKGMHFDGCNIVTASLFGKYKDANEALVADKSTFIKNIEQILKDPDKYLTNLIKRIEERQSKQLFIPTGFSNLDKVFDGGLYPQLYIIGAVSSLGKTTFTLQIADKIAQQKHPVFFFSLETSKDTLTEKIISRITFDTADGKEELAQRARSIDNGYFLEVDDNGKLSHPDLYHHVMKAFNYYSDYYNYLMINNGITNRPSATDIYNEVKRYCYKHPNSRPVVIVDYLQILKPVKDGLTDKEAVTSSVAKLNELTEEFQAPVILISSFNRQNYNNEVSMQSFKESGEIEYYSDVLLGLQYQQDSKPDFEHEDPTIPRNVEAVILKNRNGSSHRKVKFNFYNAYNEFIPDLDD